MSHSYSQKVGKAKCCNTSKESRVLGSLGRKSLPPTEDVSLLDPPPCVGSSEGSILYIKDDGGWSMKWYFFPYNES